MLDKSAKVLRGHAGAIRSLTYDPEGDLLASASTDGTLRIWKLADSSCVIDLQVLPERADELLKIDWHPNGKFIAVPVGNTVAVYERDTWELAFSFAGEEGHSQPVTMAAWSPNGEYLASVSVAGEIIVWETQARRTLGRFRHRDRLQMSAVAWHPKGNEILWADTNGKVCVWKEPVPDAGDFVKPTGGDVVAAVEENQAKLDTLFDDDDDEDVGVTKRRKRIKQKKRAASQMNDSDDDDDMVTAAAMGGGGGAGSAKSPGSAKKRSGDADGSRKRRATAVDEGDDDEESSFEADFGGPSYEVMLQKPFQPSSTPLAESRRILVWNNVGVITSREEELTSSVDVEFHNVQKHKPIRMIDHYGFTLGALGARSIAMAGPSRSPTAADERDNPSILFCRNIDHWASDETWQVFFPEGEEVEAIAVGSGAQGVIAAAGNDFPFVFSSFLLGSCARSQFFPRGKNSDLPSSPRDVASPKKERNLTIFERF
jgi:chromosome transmission fidelity protein 4